MPERTITLYRCDHDGLFENPRPMKFDYRDERGAATRMLCPVCSRPVKGRIVVPTPEHYKEVVAAGNELYEIALTHGPMAEARRKWRSLVGEEQGE